MNETLTNPNQENPNGEEQQAEIIDARTIVKNEDGSITDSAFPNPAPAEEAEPAPAPVVEEAAVESVPEPVAEVAPEVVAPATSEFEGEAIVSVKPEVNQERPETQTDHLGGIAIAAAATGTALVAGAKRILGKSK